MEIERERGGATIFQNKASKGRREERKEEGDWREDLAREKEGFVLKGCEASDPHRCASNLLFHHSLVRSFYTRACSPQILLLSKIVKS